MDALLTRLLASSPPVLATATLDAWRLATTAHRAAAASTIDRAALGGACADRLGFAFAAAYAEALHALVPSLGGRIAALCATEDGGAHPRAIRTALVLDDTGGYTLTGRKRWATAADGAADLLVVASLGADDAGRNRLRVARVSTHAPGVRLTVTTAPFVPEIPHAEVELDHVRVAADDVLPGDGYDRYLKPFRTIEDLHVHAALLAYLAGVVRRHALAPALLERAFALLAATRSLAAGAAAAPATHLALAGLLDLVTAFVTDLEAAWSAPAPASDEHARWQRDRPLLRVAASARTARRDAARAALVAGPPT